MVCVCGVQQCSWCVCVCVEYSSVVGVCVEYSSVVGVCVWLIIVCVFIVRLFLSQNNSRL